MNMTNNLVPFKKIWKNADGTYGLKDYWFNPNCDIQGLEACKGRINNIEVDCVKIFYADNFIMLVGSVEVFVKTCKDAQIAVSLIMDLHNAGITIKQFMQQTERLNGVEF